MTLEEIKADPVMRVTYLNAIWSCRNPATPTHNHVPWCFKMAEVLGGMNGVEAWPWASKIISEGEPKSIVELIRGVPDLTETATLQLTSRMAHPVRAKGELVQAAYARLELPTPDEGTGRMSLERLVNRLTDEACGATGDGPRLRAIHPDNVETLARGAYASERGIAPEEKIKHLKLDLSDGPFWPVVVEVWRKLLLESPHKPNYQWLEAATHAGILNGRAAFLRVAHCHPRMVPRFSSQLYANADVKAVVADWSLVGNVMDT